MSIKIKVMKFGGASIDTPQSRYYAALRVVASKEQGYCPVVVVSAIGREGQPYATDTLLNYLNNIDPTVKPDAREIDLMLACGEIISSTIFSHTLKTLGHPAQAFRGGQAGIRTDGIFNNARIVGINPVSLLHSIEQGYIPVVCGFQGLYVRGDGTPGGELTTLGRGGSDTTAAALGAALKAERVEIFTHIDGVKATNPLIIPHAKTLNKMTYDEVAEFAHLGAKVLHPRAAEIAMKYQIPLHIKNTFNEEPGTEIIQDLEQKPRSITGVTHTGRLIHLQLNLQNLTYSHQRKLQQHIYKLLAHYGFNLYMIDLSPNSMGFAVPREQYSEIEELFNGLVIPFEKDQESTYLFQIGCKPSRQVETQAMLLNSLGNLKTLVIQPTENCTMVSLVAKDYLNQPGVFLKILQIFEEYKIQVLQISDSDSSMSFLILESDIDRAVKLMYDCFKLDHIN